MQDEAKQTELVPVDRVAEDRAESALYAYAQEEWGWGSDEYQGVIDAVYVVIAALRGQS